MRDWHCLALAYENDEFIKFGSVFESFDFYWSNAIVTINGV